MQPRGTRSGAGIVIIAVYAVFAISASARAGVQILTKFEVAPVPFALSGLAALMYVVITWALYRGDTAARRVAHYALGAELFGVIVIGAISLLVPTAFPEATVWSDFGRGYGFIPLVLPIIGLIFLRKAPGTAAK